MSYLARCSRSAEMRKMFMLPLVLGACDKCLSHFAESQWLPTGAVTERKKQRRAWRMDSKGGDDK